MQACFTGPPTLRNGLPVSSRVTCLIASEFSAFSNLSLVLGVLFCPSFMKENVHPKYVDSEIRCACGNVIKTRSTKPVIIVGICNACHPFYTGQQKFVDTAGRVDKFQQRMAKTQAAQAAAAASKKKKR
jgi:large subunit ribosomal protein L31